MFSYLTSDSAPGLSNIIFTSLDNGMRRTLDRRHRTRADNLWFRRVTLAVTAAVLLAPQATCLQLSIDPADGSVRVQRDKRALSVPAATAVREFRECGGNLTALSLPARIYSPGYPRSYHSSQLCRWFITADGDITLRFVNAQIEESPDCEFDSADVLTGPNQTSLGKVCGAISNHTIATNSTAVTVVFKSDESYEEKGFVLEFFKHAGAAGADGDECGNTLTGEEGNLTSPGYPSHYSHNANCWTLINVDPGRIVIVRFKVIALEFEELCPFDYVEVFDGPSEESPSFGRFCGDSQKKILRSTSSSVLVHFKSDDLLSNRGFVLEYETDRAGIRVSHEGGCAVTSGTDNGTVTTPDYPDRYPPSSHCLLNLEAPRFTRVALRFVDFSVESDDKCDYDFVEIWEGLQEGWRSLGRLCGDKGGMEAIIASENRMRLRFQSDNSTQSRGFVANFYVVSVSEDPEAEDNGTLTTREKSRVPVHELVQEVSADITVTADDEEMIKCIPRVSGTSVQWLKDEALLNGSMPLAHLHVVSPGMLWIRRMNSDLVGRYTCVVTTQDRQTQATAQVVMAGEKQHGECDIFFRKSPKDQELFCGETAVMQCAAQLPQRPSSDVKISWLRNGLPFPTTSERYRDLGNGLVYISDAKPKDSAVYTCVATDRRNNCTVQESALLRVLPRVNIEEICGTPRVTRPNTLKPHMQQGKIVGGKDTVKGAHPWQVMFWSESFDKAFCGGSLLNNQWVLTASHCFKNADVRAEEVQVRLGKYDRLESEPEEVVTRVADVYFHPRFNESTYDNDIALVQLADRVMFTDYILPACLGDDVSIERDFFGSGDVHLGTVTGWGQLTESGTTLPRFLQEIRLPIVDSEICRNSTAYTVTENMFCAGYSQDIVGDACQGDSGGPFMVQQKKRWYLVGIVSWGVGCGRRDSYGFYTKVNNYHGWIKEKILY